MSAYGNCDVCGQEMADGCDPHTLESDDGYAQIGECHPECCPKCNPKVGITPEARYDTDMSSFDPGEQMEITFTDGSKITLPSYNEMIEQDTP